MKILFLSPSGQSGGAERSLGTLIESVRLEKPDWCLHVLLAADGPFARRMEALGANVRVVPFPPSLASSGRASRSNPSQVLSAALRYRLHLAKAIREIAPDMLHSNGSKMHLLVATLGARTLRGAGRVCHVHEFASRNRSLRWLSKVTLNRFDRVVPVSDGLKADLEAVGVQSRKLVTISNGVNLSHFCAFGAELDLDRISGLSPASGEPIRIGLVATFARWKGHAVFLRALSLMQSSGGVRTYIIGGPIYQTMGGQTSMDELRETARTLCPHMQVGFTGVIENIEEAYRSLDIVVHASTQPEPFGMVLIEALASGRALIVSDNGAVNQIVEADVTGLVYPSGDATTLARQMDLLVVDRALRARLGSAGRASVAGRFGAATMAAQFIQLYEELCPEAKLAVLAETPESKRCFA